MKLSNITNIKKFVLISVLVVVLFVPGFVLAQTIEDPLGGGTILDLARGIIKGIRQLALPVAVAMIIVAGIMFMTSQGEPTKITTARKLLLYTLLGFAIILIGEGFLSLIKSILELRG